jgi:hypothetical protein
MNNAAELAPRPTVVTRKALKTTTYRFANWFGERSGLPANQ